MGKKPVISLRVYRGKQMSYDVQGKVQNENQLVKLIHDTIEWKNFMKNLIANGYLKVDVESVKVVEVKEGKEIISGYDNEILIKKEVEEVFKAQTTVPMSSAEKRIAELEAKIEKLLASNEQKGTTTVEQKVKAEKKPKADKKVMENLRIDYAELNDGKKAFPGWDEITLREKIEELKNKQ